MPARVRRLELSPSERRAARRINALLGAMPRLKAYGWRLQAGQWASVNFGGVAARVTGAWLRARGVGVETLRIPSPDGTAVSGRPICGSPPGRRHRHDIA